MARVICSSLRRLSRYWPISPINNANRQLHQRRRRQRQPKIGFIESPLEEPGIESGERKHRRHSSRRREKIGQDPDEKPERHYGKRGDRGGARRKRSPAQQIRISGRHDLDAAEINPVLAGEAGVEAVGLIRIVEIGMSDEDHMVGQIAALPSAFAAVRFQEHS